MARIPVLQKESPERLRQKGPEGDELHRPFLEELRAKQLVARTMIQSETFVRWSESMHSRWTNAFAGVDRAKPMMGGFSSWLTSYQISCSYYRLLQGGERCRPITLPKPLVRPGKETHGPICGALRLPMWRCSSASSFWSGPNPLECSLFLGARQFAENGDRVSIRSSSAVGVPCQQSVQYGENDCLCRLHAAWPPESTAQEDTNNGGANGDGVPPAIIFPTESRVKRR